MQRVLSLKIYIINEREHMNKNMTQHYRTFITPNSHMITRILSFLCIVAIYLSMIYAPAYNAFNPATKDTYSSILETVTYDTSFSISKLLHKNFSWYKYDTLDALLAAPISFETEVSTRGFSKVNDGGGAVYKITKHPVLDVNPYTTFEMANGMFAELKFDYSSNVDVASMGIFPNEKVSAKLNQVHKLLDGQVSGIVFNQGTYYIECPLYLKSFNYYGNNTTLAVSKDFNCAEVNVILTKKSDTKPYKIGLYNINFLFETSKDQSLYNVESVFVALRYIAGCIINDCNFIVRPADINGAFQEVVVLWFKQTTMMQNISIERCQVRNLTAQNYSGDVNDNLIGGTLLFSGEAGTTNHKFTNIIIKDCKLESTINDETLSFWNGIFENIFIKNTEIINSNHPSNNFITFYNGEFHGVQVNDCTITANEPARNIIKLRQLTNASELSFTRTNFYGNISKENPSRPSVSIFKADDITNNFNGKTSVKFEGCAFAPIAGNGNTYDSLIRIYNSKNVDVSMKWCTNTYEVRYGKVWLSNSKNSSVSLYKCQGIDNGDYAVLHTQSNIKVQ